MSDHARFLQRTRFAELDGLRALAVLAVIWHHTRPPEWNSGLASSGFHGVTLFFAISGFLITSLLLRERVRNGRIDLAAFYVRRTLRIFPLYFATLAIYTALVFFVEKHSSAGAEFWRNLKYFATYTSNLFVPLGDGRTIFYFAWSLAAEEQFYLIWPPMLVLLGRSGRAATALGVVIGGYAMAWSMGAGFVEHAPLAIVLGSLFAVTLHHPVGYAALSPWIGRPWSPAIIAGLGIACIAVPNVPNYVVHVAAAAMVVSCSMQARSMLTPLLTTRALSYIGSISYGLYMLHMLAKNVYSRGSVLVGLPNGGLWTVAGTIGIAMVLATLSFRYFETPILRIKARFER